MAARGEQFACLDGEFEGGGGAWRARRWVAQDARERGDARDPHARQLFDGGREVVERIERNTAFLPGIDRTLRPFEAHEDVLDEALRAGLVRDRAGVVDVEDGHGLGAPGQHLGQRAAWDLHEVAEVARPRSRRVQGAGLRSVDGRVLRDVPGDRPDQLGVAAELLHDEPEGEPEPVGLGGEQRGVRLDRVEIHDVRVGRDRAPPVEVGRGVDELGVAGEQTVEEHGQSSFAWCFSTSRERRRMSITRSAPARIGLIRTVQSASPGESSRDELDMR